MIVEEYFQDYEIGMMASTINLQAMSYGYDKLHFVSPMFIGDTITVEARISEKRGHPKKISHGFAHKAVTVISQHSETALTCEHLYLVKRQEERVG